MAFLIVLGIVSTVAIGATIREIRTDGYRRIPTDPDRLP